VDPTGDVPLPIVGDGDVPSPGEDSEGGDPPVEGGEDTSPPVEGKGDGVVVGGTITGGVLFVREGAPNAGAWISLCGARSCALASRLPRRKTPTTITRAAAKAKLTWPSRATCLIALSCCCPKNKSIGASDPLR
jgi:hypothetical protein